ncbi:MAG: hypothetical protein M1586_02010 [Patescibacteria group bacterium]|nr:hypothetical protein [Patescibacteria group bacterium]MCL5262056.1 hypothetical protein [Patescibacteria group bacterium]
MIRMSETPRLLAEDFKALPKAIRQEETQRENLQRGLKDVLWLPPCGDENAIDAGAQLAKQAANRDTLGFLNDLSQRAIIVEKPTQTKVAAIGHCVSYRDHRYPGQIFKVILCGEWHDPMEDKTRDEPRKVNVHAPLSKVLMGMEIGETRHLYWDPRQPPAEIVVERIE